MKIAVLGATSQIAQDLLRQWKLNSKVYELVMYSRRPDSAASFMEEIEWEHSFLSLSLLDFTSTAERFDAIINFIGQGKPSSILENAMEIMQVTYYHDSMVMAYLSTHHDCKYIFLSSGSVYGTIFDKPASEESTADVPINNITRRNAYSMAKLYAEVGHRLNDVNTIVDIRVFNIFSRHQSLNSGFFITDIVSAIKNNVVLKVSTDSIIRDFLHPYDFFQLIDSILNIKGRKNMAIDCYSKGPIEKFALLDFCNSTYGLKWEIENAHAIINATGVKSHYYSESKIAGTLGYEPKFTSLSTIFTELSMMINSPASSD